jgi:hypothetical protein
MMLFIAGYYCCRRLQPAAGTPFCVYIIAVIRASWHPLQPDKV